MKRQFPPLLFSLLVFFLPAASQVDPAANKINDVKIASEDSTHFDFPMTLNTSKSIKTSFLPLSGEIPIDKMRKHRHYNPDPGISVGDANNWADPHITAFNADNSMDPKITARGTEHLPFGPRIKTPLKSPLKEYNPKKPKLKIW